MQVGHSVLTQYLHTNKAAAPDMQKPPTLLKKLSLQKHRHFLQRLVLEVPDAKAGVSPAARALRPFGCAHGRLRSG